MNPTALYFESLNFHPDSLSLLKRKFSVVKLPSPGNLDQAPLSDIELLFAPLGWQWGEKQICRMPKLRAIASNTTGYPHIDLEAAFKRNVSVITLKGQDKFLDSITPTAEHTLGLIIAITRNYRSAMKAVDRGEWDRFPHGAEKMLSRCAVGVVGLGRLGKMVARYCDALGMRVLGYDPFADAEASYISEVNSLDELVSNVDIVTVHIPHEPETENIFDEQMFKKFRQGSFFVNTSRGELVDTNALLAALTHGQLSGAAIDVLDSEFRPDFRLKNSAAWTATKGDLNLIMTPHIGGSTEDAWRETQSFVIQRAIDEFALDG